MPTNVDCSDEVLHNLQKHAGLSDVTLRKRRFAFDAFKDFVSKSSHGRTIDEIMREPNKFEDLLMRYFASLKVKQAADSSTLDDPKRATIECTKLY